MKRINRKKLIEELEFLRQGFAIAKMNAAQRNDSAGQIAYASYHRNADKLIVELGGEAAEHSEGINIFNPKCTYIMDFSSPIVAGDWMYIETTTGETIVAQCPAFLGITYKTKYKIIRSSDESLGLPKE